MWWRQTSCKHAFPARLAESIPTSKLPPLWLFSFTTKSTRAVKLPPDIQRCYPKDLHICSILPFVWLHHYQRWRKLSSVVNIYYICRLIGIYILIFTVLAGFLRNFWFRLGERIQYFEWPQCDYIELVNINI